MEEEGEVGLESWQGEEGDYLYRVDGAKWAGQRPFEIMEGHGTIDAEIKGESGSGKIAMQTKENR